MKITLHDPPELFEAEAEFGVTERGEVCLTSSGKTDISLGGYDRIVLTPKKRKYWRLDPVATFEEATGMGYEDFRLAINGGHIDGFGRGAIGLTGLVWLKLTGCEE